MASIPDELSALQETLAKLKQMSPVPAPTPAPAGTPMPPARPVRPSASPTPTPHPTPPITGTPAAPAPDVAQMAQSDRDGGQAGGPPYHAYLPFYATAGRGATAGPNYQPADQSIAGWGALMNQVGPGGIGPRPPENAPAPSYYNYGSAPATTDAGGTIFDQSIIGAGTETWGAPPAPVADESLRWVQGYTVQGAPAWWQGMVPSQVRPDTEYATLINALIPYMSPEDQYTAATNLARLFPDGFGAYSAEKLNIIPPPEVTTALRQQYSNAERASGALTALNNMRTALGRPETDLGPGFKFLSDLATTMQKFGGQAGSPQSRQQFLQGQAALDPLLAETKGEMLSAYGPTARMLAQPFFSAGPLTTASKDQATGKLRFGSVNPRLMG